MMHANYNKVDCDIMIYGLLCTPCLFGENAVVINKHPSCFSHALTYLVIVISFHLMGGYVGNMILYKNPYVISACGTFCTSLAISEYAGNIRSQIRSYYGIYGSLRNDRLMHCLFSPCAVCQEAQEIRWRNSITVRHSIPEHQMMVK